VDREGVMGWKGLNLIWHFVEKWAEKKPDAGASVFEDERLSWRGFKERMDGIARAYLAAGVQREDRR
jgi:acyl-CoA synthetase (AMP-forming)/AMP-acid ligase II